MPCSGQCLAYRRSDAANEVLGILTGLSYLSQRHRGPIQLVCLEASAPACVIGAALTPPSVKVHVVLRGIASIEKEPLPAIPGILRIGEMTQWTRAALRKHPMVVDPGD